MHWLGFFFREKTKPTRKKLIHCLLPCTSEKVKSLYYFLCALCFGCGNFLVGDQFNLMLKSLRAETENGVNHMTTWLITSLQKNCSTHFVLSRTFKVSQGLGMEQDWMKGRSFAFFVFVCVHFSLLLPRTNISSLYSHVLNHFRILRHGINMRGPLNRTRIKKNTRAIFKCRK